MLVDGKLGVGRDELEIVDCVDDGDVVLGVECGF